MAKKNVTSGRMTNSVHVNAVVLFSGGLDSACLLLDAISAYDRVAAVGFAYGQPHQRAELGAARAISRELGVWFEILGAQGAMTGDHTVMPEVAGVDSRGVSNANVPSRNLMMLGMASAWAAREWPGQATVVLIGCNADDAAAFPDCREGFIGAASDAVRLGLEGVAQVTIRAPYLNKTKRQLVASHVGSLPLLKRTISCYLGTNCGECDACRAREGAWP